MKKFKSLLFSKQSLISAAVVLFSTSASANIIYSPANNATGTGLGAVLTLVTLQDGSAQPGTIGNNGTESGCVTPGAGGSGTPTFNCFSGLQGGDNQAINNTYALNTIPGLTQAGQLGLVVNLNEPGNDSEAVLTDLYVSLFATGSTIPLGTFSYAGPDLTLSETGGVGNSGQHLFVFDAAQAAQANALCTDLANCTVGGGVQFLAGSTDAGIETLYLTLSGAGGGGGGGAGEVPEPGSLALLGLGLLGLLGMRKKKSA